MESNLPATFPGDFVLLPGEEIKRIFYAQKLKRIPKWHPQNIATIPVRSIAPNAAWVQDPELT